MTVFYTVNTSSLQIVCFHCSWVYQPYLFGLPTLSVLSINLICLVYQPYLFGLPTLSVWSTNLICLVYQPYLFGLPTLSVWSTNHICFVYQPYLFGLPTLSVWSTNLICLVYQPYLFFLFLNQIKFCCFMVVVYESIHLCLSSHLYRTLVIMTVFAAKDFAVKSKFAVIQKLDMAPSKASVMDTFEHFFL